jgi:hypothetical protein
MVNLKRRINFKKNKDQIRKKYHKLGLDKSKFYKRIKNKN